MEDGNDLPGAEVEQDANYDQIMGMSSEDEEDAEKAKRLGEWVEGARKVEEQDVNVSRWWLTFGGEGVRTYPVSNQTGHQAGRASFD